MLIHSACPHCHNPCIWSDTCDSKYVRCCHCEKMFVISTWGVGHALDHHQKRRRRQTAPLWPWVILTGTVCALLVAGSLLYQGKEAAKQESRVTRKNFERLKVGMNEVAVFTLLGNPDRRDESILPRVESRWKLRYAARAEEFLHRCFWEDGDNLIWVDFLKDRVQDFGATLDGGQFGKNPQAPLVQELQMLDEP